MQYKMAKALLQKKVCMDLDDTNEDGLKMLMNHYKGELNMVMP